jgi:AraC-like DNA-binding protein
MDRARAMLAAQQRPSDIYEELGYEHLAAFSNEFKKHTGITPGHFRQRFEPIAQASEPMA